MQNLYYNNIVSPHDYKIALDSDEHVNLSFDTAAVALGVKYVYLGNQASRGQELLELRVDPATMLIRCIVLVCKPPITAFPAFSLDNVVCEKGVPQLSSINWPAGARHLNLNIRFRISLHERACILHWSDLSKLSRCAAIGPAKFLLSQDEVLGVLFPDLHEMIIAYIAEWLFNLPIRQGDSPTFPGAISTTQLKLSDVPNQLAPWEATQRFALTFDPAEKNPYQMPRPDVIVFLESGNPVELRAYLFGEQRRWNHMSRHPDDQTMATIRDLVALIRQRLSAQDGEPNKM